MPIKRSKENRAYKKGKAFKDTRKFIIICEGMREADYFNFFHEKYQKLIVEVLEPSGNFHGHSAPSKLIDRAIEYIKREDWDESLDDEIWFIVDTDDWGPQLYNLSNQCLANKNWFLANSNPCFELWLYYHKSSNRTNISNASAMKEALNNQTIGGYQKKEYVLLFETAINNANNMDHNKDHTIAEIGIITKVYKLAMKIKELLPYKDGQLNLM